MFEKCWYDLYSHDYMETSLDLYEIESYVDKQIDFFFPDKYGGVGCRNALKEAFDRTETCFKHIKTRSWYRNNKLFFNHLHGDQYAAFLYFYSNSLWKENGDVAHSSKLMYLNKALNGVFISFKCKMPDIFELVHPLGTILGNASYENYLVVCQGVTVNTYKDENCVEGNIPKLGGALFLGANSKVIGGKPIGKRVSLGVDTTIYNDTIADDMVVVNDNGNTIIRKRDNHECMSQRYFYDDLSIL